MPMVKARSSKSRLEKSGMLRSEYFPVHQTGVRGSSADDKWPKSVWRALLTWVLQMLVCVPMFDWCPSSS